MEFFMKAYFKTLYRCYGACLEWLLPPDEQKPPMAEKQGMWLRMNGGA
jgi:hypothetical protein